MDSISGKKPENFKIIVSSHNYKETPSTEDLGNLVAKIQATGADIVKFATTALDISDVARVFGITVHCQVCLLCDVPMELPLHYLVMPMQIFLYRDFLLQ